MRDGLTGLFTRRGLYNLMVAEEERCARYGHDACVLAIDLNGLKKVNEESGQGAGDVMICKAAQVLLSTTRKSDTVARVGGDEFIVLAVECNQANGIDLMSRIQTNLATRPAKRRARLCCRSREHGEGLEKACRAADTAMFEKKRKAA